MKKQNQKGITLIALIITIIVMLILVAVTVNVAINGGLFNTAKDGAKRTQLEADKEVLQAGIIPSIDTNTLTIPNAQTLKDNLPEGWKVTETDGGSYTATSPKGNEFNVTQNGEITEKTNNGLPIEEVSEDEEKFYRYILGDNPGKKEITKIMDLETLKFINEAETMPNAEEEVTYLTMAVNEDRTERFIYVKYKNKAYKIICGTKKEYYEFYFDEIPTNTKKIEVMYKEDSNRKITIEGKTYKAGDPYTLIGPTGSVDCMVLNINDNSMEVVTKEALLFDGKSNFYLGPNDSIINWSGSWGLTGKDSCDPKIYEEANIDGNEGITDLEKGIYSYNHAIENINKACKIAIDTAIGTNNFEVRSVGAKEDPRPNLEGDNKYDKLPESLISDTGVNYNGKMKATDLEFENDLVKLAFYNIDKCKDNYYFASRYVVYFEGKEEGFRCAF